MLKTVLGVAPRSEKLQVSRYRHLTMNLPTTLALAIVSLILTWVFGALGARPSQPGRTRLAPWRFMMLLAFTALLAMAVHLVNLAQGGARQDSMRSALIAR
jgi:hypothetical protein